VYSFALVLSVQDKCCEPTKLGEMIKRWNESFCSIHMDMFVAAHYSLVLGNSKHFWTFASMQKVTKLPDD
jgi:hypothetical protein